MADKNGSGSARAIGREAALTRLKAYAKSNATDVAENLGQTVDQETDRGAIIILTTAVEDILARRILAEMVPLNGDEHNRMFGPDAPLGSFSSKIKFAYALGLINREAVKICDVLREMRNACAHSGRPISFKNEELRDAFQIITQKLFEDVPTYDEKNLPGIFKLHLIWVVAWLMRIIRTGSEQEAYELVQRLLDEANEDARTALRKQKASQKKRAKPNQSKSRLNHKD